MSLIPFSRTKSCDFPIRPVRCVQSIKQTTVPRPYNRTRQWSDRSVLRKCVQWLDRYLESDDECIQGTAGQSWLNQPLSHSCSIMTRTLVDLPSSLLNPQTGQFDRKCSARTVATCLLATLAADHLDPRMLPILQRVVGDDIQPLKPSAEARSAVRIAELEALLAQREHRLAELESAHVDQLAVVACCHETTLADDEIDQHQE